MEDDTKKPSPILWVFPPTMSRFQVNAPTEADPPPRQQGATCEQKSIAYRCFLPDLTGLGDNS